MITTVFDSFNDDPYPSVVLENLLVTILLTAAVVYWIARSNASYALTNGDNREAVEQYFTINSAAFFVGWTWLVVTRNVAAPFTLVCEHLILGFNSFGWFTIEPAVGVTVRS